MIKKYSSGIKYALSGAIVGLGLPVIGTVLMLNHYHPLEPSATSYYELHLTHPILLLLDTAPFFLGALMGIIGLKQQQLENLTKILGDQVTERNLELINQNRFFQALLKNTPLAVVQLDINQNIISANPVFVELFGYSEREVLGRNLDELVTTPQLNQEAQEITRQVAQGAIVRKIGRRKRKDGKLVDVEILGIPVFSGGEIIGVLGLYYDISFRIRTEKALMESEARFRSLFEDSPLSLWEEDFSQVKKIVDNIKASGVEDLRQYFDHRPEVVQDIIEAVRIIDVNSATLMLFNADTKDELISTLKHILTEDSYDQFKEEILSLAAGDQNFSCEIMQRKMTGETIFAGLNLSIAPGYEETWEKVFISITDITEQKAAEMELRFLSFHDALTEAYNRAFFDEELARLEQSRLYPVGIIVCDLDNLKNINDSMGHASGDNALRSASWVLSKLFRSEDVVARIGGDEFAAILPQLKAEDIPMISNRLEEAIRIHNNKEGDDLFRPLSLSFGIVSVQKGDSLFEGLKIADQLMYENKKLKKRIS